MHGIGEGTSQVKWLSLETVRMPAPVINVSLTFKYTKEEINRYQEC